MVVAALACVRKTAQTNRQISTSANPKRRAFNIESPRCNVEAEPLGLLGPVDERFRVISEPSVERIFGSAGIAEGLCTH